MALLNKDEQRQVAEAIDRVEQRTDAELVTVLAARSDDYAYMPLIWAGHRPVAAGYGQLLRSVVERG
ncbi:hypothetical protein BV349_00862 [Pseudomonas syringae pv. actinidiae]|nr:hypothetical protein BV349_00862 [Pseudomonas syringae pv. actinidiae]OSN78993.1 hypothetical protein BV351_00860 [Pseudomonas syringae pv. actinidiae]RMS12853.1 hypothetical protein ALP75_205539 [Pseudomonas syringae pv. actinidiae]